MTGEVFDALRAKVCEMGSQTKVSASEAADAMNCMSMAGWKTEDMLNGVEGIMNLVAASGEDLAATSDIVTDALTAFGLSAADKSGISRRSTYHQVRTWKGADNQILQLR